MTIALVGPDSPVCHENITNFGRQAPEKARKIISQARYGLNYTPNVFPLNIQDLTKVIEYCAAGLGVIANRYKWVDEFERNTGGCFLDLFTIKCKSDVETFSYVRPDVKYLEWTAVIEGSGMLNRISR